MNTFVLTTKISSFPDAFVNSEGALIQEMIENICGAKRPQGLATMFKVNSKQQMNQVQQKYERMKSMLTFLKSNGAMLPTILPEFLLPRDFFITQMQKKITEWILGINYYGAPKIDSFDKKLMTAFSSTSNFSESLISRLRAADLLYKQLSAESWLIVVLQVLKIFMFSTVQYEDFLSTPGVSAALSSIKSAVSEDVFKEINRSSKEITTSNVFTPLESTLLKWATIHYDFINPSDLAIITSFSQLSDARVFASLLKSHVPRLTIDLVPDPETDEDYQHNLNNLIKAFDSLHLKIQPDAEIINEGNIIGLTLTLFELYQLLPHYISSGVVEYKAELSRTLIQGFEISNPSNVRLKYEGVVTGSENFTPIRKVVTVNPHQTITYNIEFIKNYHNKMLF